MKKFFILTVSILLAACYCRVRPTQNSVPTPAVTTAPVENNVSHTPSVPSVAPQVAPATQTVAAPKATTQQKPTSAATVFVKDNTAAQEVAPTQESAAVQEDTFLPQQAALLVQRDRANQTLSAPPADTPAFKKEEILPTQDRLLSPLAYEPLLPDNTHAPWSNESLQYGIYYSFIKAGTAYIKTRGLVNKNGKTAYLIQTTAFSASVIDAVYRVRDINYSWLDTQTLHSLGYSQSLREGNYKRDEWVTFDAQNGRFYGEIQKKEETRFIAGELDQEVLDILTSLYFVRAKPLEEGKDLVFDIVNREQKYPLIVKVLGKETVKTAAGKFHCWVVEPQIRGEGIFVAKGKNLKVWLTDDTYRMPVKMAVEVFIGSVSAELLAYERN